MGDGQFMDKILSNPLSGKVLKTSIAELTGATIIRWSDNSSNSTAIGYSGYMYEELIWLAHSLNFSLEMVPKRTSYFGVFNPNNGSWTGVRGQLQRREVDLVCSAFSGIYDRGVTEVAAYAGSDMYGMLTQNPTPNSSIYGHVIIFSPMVWLGLIISMIACTIFIKLLTVLNRKFFGNGKNDDSNNFFDTMENILEYVFATITNHGVYYKLNQRSLAVLAATWCFATFVFVNVYCSCLTSYMSLIFQRPDINTLRDLAENSNYQPVTLKGSVAESILLDPKSTGLIKEVGNKLLKCPTDICRTSGFDESAEKVLEGKFVAFTPILFSKNLMHKTLLNGTCHLTMAHYVMANNNYFMACPKNSPYAFPLYEESIRYFSTGMNSYWKKKFSFSAPQCELKYNNQGECVNVVDQARLKLEQFYIAFAVLFGGYVLAFLQFLRERFITRC